MGKILLYTHNEVIMFEKDCFKLFYKHFQMFDWLASLDNQLAVSLLRKVVRTIYRFRESTRVRLEFLPRKRLMTDRYDSWVIRIRFVVADIRLQRYDVGFYVMLVYVS